MKQTTTTKAAVAAATTSTAIANYLTCVRVQKSKWNIKRLVLFRISENKRNKK